MSRVEEFLAFQRAGGRHRASWSRPGLRCLLDVLDGLGLAAQKPVPASSRTEVLVACFKRYLLTERGLAPGTDGGDVRHARCYLGGLPPEGGLGRVTAAEVTAAVLHESTAVSVSAAQFFVAGLRSFLRFCSPMRCWRGRASSLTAVPRHPVSSGICCTHCATPAR